MAFVIVYAALLLCVPSQLIVGPLGAAGTPANLCGLAALLWWVCATLGGINSAPTSPVRIAVAILALAVLASYAAAMSRGWYAPTDVRESTNELFTLLPVDANEISDKMISGADRGLLTFGGWAGIMLLTCDGLRSWSDLDRLVSWLSWLATFVALLGILQFFTGIDIASLFRIPGLVANSDFGEASVRSVLRRVSSTAVHPIEFGVVLAGIFPLALHRAIFRTRSNLNWLPTIVLGIAIPMSVSRSAILALALMLVIFLISWPPKWRWRTLIVVPIATIGLRLLVPGLVGTIRSLFTSLSEDPSVSGRTDDYSVVFRIFGHDPWLGRGLFTFIPRYYRVLDNQYLVSLVELGAIGLCALFGLFAVGYFSARKARRWTLDPEHRHLGLAISASIFGVSFSFATFDALSFPMAAGVLFLVIGMSGAAWQAARSNRPATNRPIEAVDPEAERILV